MSFPAGSRWCHTVTRIIFRSSSGCRRIKKEYIKYVINLEYDRMVSLTSSGKKSMKCFEFTSVEDGLADYGSQKVHDVWVEQNPLTRECTFFVWVRTSNLEPKFCRKFSSGFSIPGWTSAEARRDMDVSSVRIFIHRTLF